MKKLIYGALFLATLGIVIVGCKKEVVTSGGGQSENYVNHLKASGTGGEHVAAVRSYFWDNGKLNCTNDGSGCEVKSAYKTENGEIDLSELQLLELMKIGYLNLNRYFVDNDLSYEFPNLYSTETISKIASNELILTFKFPYLIMTNNTGNIVKVFNYEGVLNNSSIRAAMQNGTTYDKKASLNTDPNNPVVWKCNDPGDNCATSKFSYNEAWLADNPEYMYAPTSENIDNAVIDRGPNTTRVIITTVTGNHFGIQF